MLASQRRFGSSKVIQQSAKLFEFNLNPHRVVLVVAHYPLRHLTIDAFNDELGRSQVSSESLLNDFVSKRLQVSGVKVHGIDADNDGATAWPAML